MKVLFVAMAQSVHAARWIGQLSGLGWELHLVSVDDVAPHAALTDITYHGSPLRRARRLQPTGSDAQAREPKRAARLAGRVERFCGRLLRLSEHHRRAAWLARVIDDVRPDIIHSMELLRAGRLVATAKPLLRRPSPIWLASNWGSELNFLAVLDRYSADARCVMKECDAYGCECNRDVALARQYGFTGRIAYVMPNAGGFDLAEVQSCRTPGPTSTRRLILLKGYQDVFGRALFGLEALRRCSGLSDGRFEIGVFSADESTAVAAEHLAKTAGLPIKLLPRVDHRGMLTYHGRARVSIGLSASDGISTSSLEAMVMGSFPIQSDSSCAGEYFRPGKSGLLVPACDPAAIAGAIDRALRDDALVDTAAQINDRILRERLDARVLQPRAVAVYEQLLQPGWGGVDAAEPTGAGCC